MVSVAWEFRITTWRAFVTVWQVSHGIVNLTWRQALEVGIPILVGDRRLLFHLDSYTWHKFLFLV